MNRVVNGARDKAGYDAGCDRRDRANKDISAKGLGERLNKCSNRGMKQQQTLRSPLQADLRSLPLKLCLKRRSVLSPTKSEDARGAKEGLGGYDTLYCLILFVPLSI